LHRKKETKNEQLQKMTIHHYTSQHAIVVTLVYTAKDKFLEHAVKHLAGS